ncbi:hypothetical protein Pse7367_0943 [Thalassoporum mexicanum PCC 7367]|uniref:hypothetical protein n=1 Tax=Thalassoporum mexicanum TaxID=3457544 RepID=UPI00029F9587|nr:hypothetical protein [Pseudanabaena sp. PCC 7367]AFY69243.1 hypothetical protein Pse7367_0943 [Pseudanabaena sp. PCC 7367]
MNQSSQSSDPPQSNHASAEQSMQETKPHQDHTDKVVNQPSAPAQNSDRRSDNPPVRSDAPGTMEPGKSAKGKKKIKKIKVVPNILETAGNDTLYGSSGHDIFVYRPGDGLLRIEDAAGVNTLVLKNIHHDQIRVNIRPDGFLVVTYCKKAIVEMRGIDYIQTNEGVFPVEDWIVM